MTFNYQLSKYLYNIQVIQLIAFIIALVISYLLTPLVQSRAMKLGLLDKPGKRKIHDKPTPRLGGVCIFVSLFLTTIFFLATYWKYKTTMPGTFTLLGIFSGGAIIFFLGLLDDIDPLPSLVKLFMQFFAASVAWFLGIRIVNLANPLYHANFHYFKLSVGDSMIHIDPLLSFIITLLWIVIITNAVNLIDGMDGLATGVCLISAIAIWSVSVDYRINQPGGALLAATLAGALLGFLRWNFNPARIFLGDSGAYLVGFVLSTLAVSCVTKKITIAVISPVLILIFAFPIGDILFAVVRRLVSGKSILQPDKEHLHHRMLAFGFSQKIASYLLYMFSACLGLVASYLISGKSSIRFLILSGFTITIALFYTYIINWRRQKYLRDIFIKGGDDS